MNWWQAYWAMAGCMAGFVLGCFAGRGEGPSWRRTAVALAAGALWPGTLLAGWFIERLERDKSA
jgi:hypothetical protein